MSIEHSQSNEHSHFARRWLGSVRVRSVLASVLIVGIAASLGALGVTSLVRAALYTSVTNTARAESLDISSFITTRKAVPAHLPSAAADMAAQIVDTNGNVLTSSMNIAGQSAMTALSPKPGQELISTGIVLKIKRFTHVDLNLDHRFVVAAVGYKSAGFAGTVLVANSLGAADHVVGLLERALDIAIPVLVLLVGALTWLLTGWALLPVEQIRSEVAEFSAKDLRRRIPALPVQDEIGRLAYTMNAMLDRLEASNQQQQQLVADVSHELRNPLAALRAQLEIAVEHPGPGAGSLLEGSIVEVNRMSLLVENLLTLARFDEGKLSPLTGEVDLDDLALIHADRLRQRGRVQVSVQGIGAARIRGDESQLTRVVANLADNAERHASHCVRFAVSERDDAVRLVISDDGPGVPSGERDHIFERFVRLDSARTYQDTGAGLGLAIVREIVAAHGGSVWVEDAKPGAQFVVELPAEQGAL